MFEAPDIRPLSTSDLLAANRRHDEMLANSPWFRLCRHTACVAAPSPRHSDQGTEGVAEQLEAEWSHPNIDTDELDNGEEENR
jgi:hypothetical protein